MAGVSGSAEWRCSSTLGFNAYVNFSASVSEASYDPIANTSKVNWSYKIWVTATAGWTFIGSTRSHAGLFKMWVNGGKVAELYTGLPHGLTNGTVLKEGSGSTTVSHNSDGTKSISFSAQIDASDDDYGKTDIYRWNSTGNKSGTLGLTSIDRSASSPTMGSPSVTHKTASCPIVVPFACTTYKARRSDGDWFDVSCNLSKGSTYNDTWYNLSPNTDYTFYYQFRNEYNHVYSPTVSFSARTSKPPAPTAGSVSASNLTYNSAKLSWSGFSFGDSASWGKYQYKLGNGSWNDCGSNSSVTLSNLSPNTSYTFYVRLIDNYGTASSQASTSFTTPKPNAPSKGSVSAKYIKYNGATLSWSGFSFGAGATWGKYQYKVGSGSWNDCGSDTSVSLSLSANTTYTFYVRLVDNYGTTSSEASVSFTTLKPDTPSKGSASVSEITPFTAIVSWNGFSFGEGGTWGKYQYKIDNGSWNDCGSNTSKTISNLNPETQYTVYVRLVDNYGTASSEASVTFTTLIDQVREYIKVKGSWEKGRLFYKKEGKWLKVKKVRRKSNGTWGNGLVDYVTDENGNYLTDENGNKLFY